MTDPRANALRNTRLAAELDDREIDVLAGILTLRDLASGEVLVAEGSTDNHLYVVVHGVLGVVKGAGTADAVTLHTLSTGDFVDELGFMDGTPYYAAKVALSDLQVLGASSRATRASSIASCARSCASRTWCSGASPCSSPSSPTTSTSSTDATSSMKKGVRGASAKRYAGAAPFSSRG
jgi:hypothetical protein